ncbi:MAG TPA: LuxR C-terminal-related transcriptional regulator [Solirubrobacterales bacterium]|nr:LuxR C-terminal-related transcriptional regulator [Solirubrobacterales bacterium]
MARGSGSDADRLAGEEALARGKWREARASFARALAAAETPEALEGLSWAAWWLDDAKTVFSARERAYRLYERADDRAGAARMATWLAVDHLDFNGAAAVANGWLQRAQRLLEPLEPGIEHGWLAFQQGYLARANGEDERARELAGRAADLGRRLGEPDLEMLGLALEGSTLVAGAEVDAGMRCLDEATALALAGEAQVPIAGAWACCFMVSSCITVSDYDRASEWCERIAEFADRYGSRYMLAFCRAEYGAVHLWKGRWTEAEEMLEASVEDFSRSRPAWIGGPLTQLAELRRRQGRAAEAAQLLDRAGASATASLCRARLSLDRGDAEAATELLERLLRQLPDAASEDRPPALELLVRAAVAAGRIERAAAALEALREAERRFATAPLRASCDLAGGIVAAARGEHGVARRLLEDAVDRFERVGAPFESACARIELAATLRALERGDAAAREAAVALEQLTALGAAVAAERAREVLEQDRAGATDGVTPREKEVLTLLAEGLTNREIAERLVVSEHTVHRHVTNILRKLELPSRAAAAVYAARSGLLE